MNTHVVVKALPAADGQRLKPGTEVDASEWRTTNLLVKQGYLRSLEGVAPVYGGSPITADFEGELFEAQVIAVIKKNLSENGELAELLRPSESATSARKPRQSASNQS